jgi:hypothetical protein
MIASTLLVLSLLGSAPAVEPAPAPGAVFPRHQLSFFVHSGAAAYLSDARTQGGVGGGFGVRDTLDGRWLLQADVSGLTGLGSVLAVRLGVGAQIRGICTPAVRLELSGLFGDRLSFLNPDHPTPIGGPAVALGLVVAPIRFTFEGTQMSVLELGVGAGTDAPGMGLRFSLTLLEVGMAL